MPQMIEGILMILSYVLFMVQISGIEIGWKVIFTPMILAGIIELVDSIGDGWS